MVVNKIFFEEHVIEVKDLNDLVRFIEPLCYLANKAEKSNDMELHDRIQKCVDYIYDQIRENYIVH